MNSPIGDKVCFLRKYLPKGLLAGGSFCKFLDQPLLSSMFFKKTDFSGHPFWVMIWSQFLQHQLKKIHPKNLLRYTIELRMHLGQHLHAVIESSHSRRISQRKHLEYLFRQFSKFLPSSTSDNKFNYVLFLNFSQLFFR